MVLFAVQNPKPEIIRSLFEATSMKLSIFGRSSTRRLPSATHSVRPSFETLEDRALLSVAPIRAPLAPTHAILASQTLSLLGQVNGTWTNTSTTQSLKGGGTVQPLGSVTSTGTLAVPASGNGSVMGTMVFTTSSGSITVKISGTLVRSASGTSSTVVSYTILGGTGAYGAATGSGSAVLKERPEQRPVAVPGRFTPGAIIAASFSLSFGS
jgi:hypothetical protein